MPSRINNQKVAGILALTGCLGFLIALGALFIGLWIDQFFGESGMAIVCVIAGTAPINLYLMVRFALALKKKWSS
ncbi:MAG: hypothetical protein AAFN11_01535 [Chloroflexota bacterium]